MRKKITIPEWTCEWLQLTQAEDDILSLNAFELDEIRLQKSFRIMALDIAEILKPYDNRIYTYIKACLEDDVCLWLLEAIAIYNIYKNTAKKVENIFHPGRAEDFFYQEVDITLFVELYEQVIYYSTNWKLSPPELRTLWNLEMARESGAQALVHILNGA